MKLLSALTTVPMVTNMSPRFHSLERYFRQGKIKKTCEEINFTGNFVTIGCQQENKKVHEGVKNSGIHQQLQKFVEYF